MFALLKGLIELMRPLQWTKSLANMIVAVVFAGFLYNVKFDAGLFALGSASLFFLWSGLYALNDYTDRKEDALHPLKKTRAIPSGRVPARLALLFSIALIVLSFLIAFTINNLLVLCLAGMLINHLLYTMKPFSFKKRPVVDLISGSLVNPLFRFYSGWVLFVPAFNAPLLPLIMILSLQFGGYGLYRMISHDFEKSRGYRSSVIVFGQKIKYVFYAGILVGIVAYFFACINSVLKIPGLGFLPLRYIWLAILSAPLAPLYIPAIKNPKNVNTAGSLRFIYLLLYLHALVFFVSFFLLYFLF